MSFKRSRAIVKKATVQILSITFVYYSVFLDLPTGAGVYVLIYWAKNRRRHGSFNHKQIYFKILYKSNAKSQLVKWADAVTRVQLAT